MGVFQRCAETTLENGSGEILGQNNDPPPKKLSLGSTWAATWEQYLEVVERNGGKLGVPHLRSKRAPSCFGLYRGLCCTAIKGIIVNHYKDP